jgi:hypothetical protein
VDKQLDTHRPGPPCEPVLRRSVCPSRSCTERIKDLVHGEAYTTDTNRRRRKAPSQVPAFACRTARLSPRQDACRAPLRAGHEHRFRRRPPGNHPRKGCGWVVHNGASVRLRANWDGPFHGRAESGTPRCGQPVRDSGMRTRRNYPTCSSPLDSSAHRRASGSKQTVTVRHGRFHLKARVRTLRGIRGGAVRVSARAGAVSARLRYGLQVRGFRDGAPFSTAAQVLHLLRGRAPERRADARRNTAASGGLSIFATCHHSS